MAANTAPIYGRTPDLQVCGSVIGSAANTATDGTGANISLIYTADATEGSFVSCVRLKAISTIAATVARFWVCTATGAFTPGTTNTAANTTMLGELTVSGWSASNNLASPVYEFPVNMPLNASFKILVSFGTSTGAATTGFNPLTIAMDY